MTLERQEGHSRRIDEQPPNKRVNLPGRTSRPSQSREWVMRPAGYAQRSPYQSVDIMIVIRREAVGGPRTTG